MTEHILTGLTSILILGITAQWLAWRLHLPSILLLLLFGFLAGPVTGLLNPNELLGDLLFPVISMSVALILFEGGLSLKLADLQETGYVVRNLITIGTTTTWFLSAGAAHLLLDFELPLAFLFGAVLVVTGPTVIIPLLRTVRITEPVKAIVKWEGIVNDPIGALLAVLVFEAILISGFAETASAVVTGVSITIFGGILIGGLSILLLTFLFRRHWIPDYLQSSLTLMVVIAAFTASNLLQAEAGLFTVTLMGVILANQKAASIKHIVEFKENLGILLLSSLFIILAARLKLEDLANLGFGSVTFITALVLIVRPAAVFFSTVRSNLSWKEKLFLAWMAPRGIVAAAVTAVFALELAEQAGYHQAELMVSEMFFVIVSTVTLYGLSAAPLGRWLDLAQPNPQGVLFVGAHSWARKLAAAIKNAGYPVLLIDTNRSNIQAARLMGLPATYASILSEYVDDKLDLDGLGRLLALTSNNEVNSLAALHFTEVFGRAKVYQLSPEETETNRTESVSRPLRGRLLFGENISYEGLNHRFEKGSAVKVILLTEQFDYQTFRECYGQKAIPLFLIDKFGNLAVFTADNNLYPQPKDSLVSVVEPTEEVVNDNQ